MDQSERLLGMAANVLPEFPPHVRVAAARTAGFQAAGIWFDSAEWDARATRRVATELALDSPYPVIPLDIEVIRIGPGSIVPDAARRLITIGGELGARNVIVVSENPDFLETRRQFESLCELAAQAEMRAVLEFLMTTSIRSLAAALDVVRSVGHPAGGILIDPLHLQRGGDRPEQLETVPRELIPYAQFCDGPAEISGSRQEDYREDAINGRSSPGEGGLPLHALLDRLPPELALSLEVRSRKLREEFPSPVDRAKAVLDRTERFLASRRERSTGTAGG